MPEIFHHSAPQTIDAHHHVWRYNPAEFDCWLNDALLPLRRDFLPSDLLPCMRAAKVDGLITVQTCQTMEETRWLLQLAEETPEIRGVVGWAPLTSDSLAGLLDDLPSGALKGLRHILQAEPDADFILREDFNRGIRTLETRGLVYDILIFERHLPQTIAFVDRHPHQQFVLDHIAKPQIATGMLEPWAGLLKELARRPNVACKLSGLVTEADPHRWTAAQLDSYLETAVEAFGPERLLAGSDWPVLLAGCEYPRWFELLRDFFAPYSDRERAAIFGENAISIYRL